MKQNFILWLAAIIIVFLAGYMNSTTGPYYPVSGTIGLDGQPVTFKFDKIYKGNDGYVVNISTDVKNISAWLIWRIVPENNNNNIVNSGEGKNSVNWQKTKMNYSGKIITGKLPAGKPGEKISCRVELDYNGKQYYLPADKPVTIELWGKVNPEILQLYYFLLFGGLILGVKTGLEVFKDKPKIGIYTIFTVIFFFLYSVCLVPLVKTYELNAINHIIPSLSQLITAQSFSLLILWIVGMGLIFNIKGNKIIPLILSGLTLIIYITIHF
jgi:hypothetical protein